MRVKSVTTSTTPLKLKCQVTMPMVHTGTSTRMVHATGLRVYEYTSKCSECNSLVKSRSICDDDTVCHLCHGIGQHRHSTISCNLYFFRITGTSIWKVGITARTVEERYLREGDNIISDLIVWRCPTRREAVEYESAILREFKDYKYYGEKLFRKTGTKELFTEDITKLQSEAWPPDDYIIN